MSLCARCLDRVGISDQAPTTGICALCLGLLQDSVLDNVMHQVPDIISKYATKSRKTQTTVKIAVSLPVSIIAREYALAAHLEISDPNEWESAKEICKKVIAEKLNVLLKDYNIAPLSDVNALDCLAV